MFANSGRARAHSHRHAHGCRNGHTHGSYHGQNDHTIGIAYWMHRGHARLGGMRIPQQWLFKMQPKIVVVLVLRTTEHPEFILILYFWVCAQRKTAQNGPKMAFFQNLLITHSKLVNA